MSGYPSRAESPHDWIENSHASTALSYAHGIAIGLERRGEDDRHVVAVLGDGSLTGGMAYEALNNLGHAGTRVVIVLNDNGRSYAPTVSRLSAGLTQLRLSPSYVHARERARHVLRAIPGLGGLAYSSLHGLTSAVREIVTPHRFFEALGVRYAGPIDGHDIAGMEQALAHATEWGGPIVVHVITQKGRGYAPAEEDDVQRLHDFKVQPTAVAPSATIAPATYTDAFTRAVLDGRPAAARGRGHHRGDARPDRAAPVPGRVPRPVPRRRASPSSTPSPPPPAWPWRDCGPWWPSTPPSSAAPSTRPTSTSACTACPWSSPSTAPASPVTTGPATTASSTSR